MNLLGRLSALPKDLILIEDDARRLSVGELQHLGNYSVGNLAEINIGIMTADPILGLRALALFDGRAAGILLISNALSAESAARLLDAAGCTVLVTDRDDISVDNAIKLVRDLDNLVDAPSDASTCETRWLMTTSGTTGEPKIVSHSLASLSRTVRTATLSGGPPIWGMLYDFTRFAGMQVFLQAVLSGARLVVADIERPLEDRLAAFAAAGVTHLSATPTLWRKILMTPTASQLKPRQITLGGEVVDDRILTALRHAWPGARIVHIFASTEAGVGFSVTDGRAGFPRTYLEDAPANVDIRVDGDRLFIRNSLVASTYVGSGEDIADADGWVATGDVVELTEERVLFLGRASGLINVGGDKVLPEEVEQVLISHPAVSAVRVFGKRNPITGALVAAEVALNENPPDNATIVGQLRAFAAEHLPPHKVPALIRIVPKLSTNAAGKIVRSNP